MLVSGGAQTSSSGIAGRIVRAAGAQGVNQLARVVQLFLLVPICLSAWGTAAYEDWLLLNSITAFLVLADLGFVQFTTVKLIDAWSRGDKERFSREWGLALALFAAMSAALTCVLGVSWAEPAWTSLIPVRRLHTTELASIAALLSLTQLLWIWITLGLGVYKARGDVSRSYHVSSILVALQTAGIAVPASLGEGPVAAALGNCIVSGATLATVVVDLCWRYRDMAWKPAWPPFDELSRRVREAIGYLVSPVATTVMLSGPNLILANSGAPQGAIALFSTTRTIAGVARQLPYQFAHPAGVELAGLLARGDRKGLYRVYESASRALAIIVGMLSGVTVVVAPLVMTLWTRGQIVYDPELMLLLVGTTVVCAPAQVAYTLLWYGGYPGRLNKALIFSTVLAMGLAVLLAPRFGTRGVAVGLGVGEIVGMAVYLSLVVDWLLERKSGTGLLRNFCMSLLSFLGSAVSGYVVHQLIGPRGWFGLLEFGFAWAIPAALGVYWVLLSGPQKARVTAAATSVVRTRRARARTKNTTPGAFGLRPSQDQHVPEREGR
jgi:O-antigen/teichoic acid export membrane protein